MQASYGAGAAGDILPFSVARLKGGLAWVLFALPELSLHLGDHVCCQNIWYLSLVSYFHGGGGA